MNPRIRSILPLALLTFVLLTGAAPQKGAKGETRAPDPAAEARGLVEALRRAAGIPGLSVAVGVGDRIVWSEGFGVADVDSEVAATPETRYRAASVSKVLTMAAAARLDAEKRLDLDAPVSRYVPSYSGPPGVTARRLAGHLAGIRHYREGDDSLGLRHFDSVGEALAAFADDSLVAPPGTGYHYSTFGFVLLSAAIEGAAKEPFLDYMEQAVFLPLGMRDTGPDLESADLPGRTRFYNRGADGKVVAAPFEDPSYKWAGGGFLTTAPDLVRFAMSHLESGFLPKRVRAEMFESQRDADGQETGVGLGWRIGMDGAGRRIVHHAGSMNGARSVVMFWPNARVSIAIMTNLQATPAFVEQTAEMVAGPWLRRAEGREPGPAVAPPTGRFEYRGTVNADSARGRMELGAPPGALGWIDTPASLAAILRANGLPNTGRFEIPGAYAAAGQLQLVLATPFGLLPMKVQPDDAGGFAGETRAGQVTFTLQAKPAAD